MDRFSLRWVLLRAALVVGICLLIGRPALTDDHDHMGQHEDHDHMGYYGAGHAQWHDSFYKNLMIPGTKTSCCNLADCRPTQIRTSGDHYEIMKDGRWIKVDINKIVRTTAPDGGPHICAPDSYGGRFDPDYVFCIIMPLET